MRVRRLVSACVVFLLVLSACRATPASRRYDVTGQVLAVHADPPRLTIAHADIVDYMPAMTMTFDVASPTLMAGRTPGELVRADLEVSEGIARLVVIQHMGDAPLPEPTAAALGAGLLAVGDAAPDAALIDQDDRRRSFLEWKGSLTLVTFIYTQCPLPTYCPLMDQNFATIQRAVAEDAALRGRVRLVSVTIDPVFDTPAVLRKHAARRRADPAVWTFLTGDPVTVERFAARFGVSVIRTPPTSAEITHNLRTALVDPDGRIRKIYSGNEWTPSTVLADLRGAPRRP